MKKVIIAVPHSHTWFWTQTCLSSLIRHWPHIDDIDVKVVIVDNSPWSPAIKGAQLMIDEGGLSNRVSIVTNTKTNKFHASALDFIVENYQFNYLMAFETDVMALRPTWLEWFFARLKPSDFAVGMWHHEKFINPSCTLYHRDPLWVMNKWCKGRAALRATCGQNDGSSAVAPDAGSRMYKVPEDELRWGPEFSKTAPLDNNLPLAENPAAVLTDLKGWIAGPFAEKRGFMPGTVLMEEPSGQLKGPGWYEPGQQLHHWAVQAGFTYTVCEAMTTNREDGLPLQSIYGPMIEDPKRQLEANEFFTTAVGETVHLWGGTRALDILKHPVTCEFVKANTPMWLAREARFWRHVVPKRIQDATLELIRRYGWHITGQGSDTVSDRDREAAAYCRECYKAGGVEW